MFGSPSMLTSRDLGSIVKDFIINVAIFKKDLSTANVVDAALYFIDHECTYIHMYTPHVYVSWTFFAATRARIMRTVPLHCTAMSLSGIHNANISKNNLLQLLALGLYCMYPENGGLPQRYDTQPPTPPPILPPNWPHARSRRSASRARLLLPKRVRNSPASTASLHGTTRLDCVTSVEPSRVGLTQAVRRYTIP